MLSEMEAWVAVSDSTGGHILHTTDGGKTFTEGAALKGIGAVMQMSFINPTTAYAAAITTAQDSTVLAMGISPPPPGPAPVPADAFEQSNVPIPIVLLDAVKENLNKVNVYKQQAVVVPQLHVVKMEKFGSIYVSISRLQWHSKKIK